MEASVSVFEDGLLSLCVSLCVSAGKEMSQCVKPSVASPFLVFLTN